MKTLITAQDITQFTAANLNVEGHRLEITIPDAERKHLRPVIGPKLLAALLAFVESAPEPPTVTGLSAVAEATAKTAYAAELKTWREANPGALLVLWDQIKPMLAQWALVEAWPNILVHIKNAGVVVQTGKAEGTTSADAATLAQVLTAYRDTAIFRGQELSNWLESDKANYAAYVSTRPALTGRQPLGGIHL
jgi:hypothetical protein